jgi:uncharacterized Ntn-hydrolase superfamily protein
VGAAASQNITDPRLGARLLDRLEAGEDAPAAVAAVVAAGPTSGYRQLVLVDAAGRAAAHSGRHTLGVHGAALGDAAVAAGNLLAAPAVIDAMLGAYSGSGHRDLADRLLDGLRAALAAGGEAVPCTRPGWPSPTPPPAGPRPTCGRTGTTPTPSASWPGSGSAGGRCAATTSPAA